MAKNKQVDSFDAELEAAAASGTVKVLSRRIGRIEHGQYVIEYDKVVELPKDVADLMVLMHPGELRVL